MPKRGRKPPKIRIFEEKPTIKPKIAHPTAYHRPSRVVVPIPGLAIKEAETVKEVEHKSPISYTVDTPIDLTCYKDYQSVDTTANLHNTLSKFVKSVLSKDQNSTPNQTYPRGLQTRTFMRKRTNLSKGPMDTNNVTSDSIAIKSKDAASEDFVAEKVDGLVSMDTKYATSDEFVVENTNGLASMDNNNVTLYSIAKKSKNVSSDDFVAENAGGLTQIKENYPIAETLTSQVPSHGQPSKEPRANPPSETACIISQYDHLHAREPYSRENMVEKRVDKPIQSNCSHIQTPSFSMSEMVNLMDDDDDNSACLSRSKVPLVTVQGYTVKKELAQLLQLILNRHGDIAANSSFQHKKSRSSFLEQTCEIIEELKELDFIKVTIEQLKSMRALVNDLELVINVSWLGKRLDDIMAAKLIIKQSSSMKEARIKNTQDIEEIEKENEALKEKLKENQEKLDALKDETITIDRRCFEAKQKVQCFYKRSLVNDLL